MSKLYELQTKLDKSGICGNPIILDSELKELHLGLTEVAEYLWERCDRTVSAQISREAEGVKRILEARKI
jgi:hypothetical protein